MLEFINGNFKDTEHNLEKVSRLAPCDGSRLSPSGSLLKGNATCKIGTILYVKRCKIIQFNTHFTSSDGTMANDAVLAHLGSSISDCRSAIRAVIKLSTVIKAKSETRLTKIVCRCVDGIFGQFFRNPSSDQDKRKYALL